MVSTNYTNYLAELLDENITFSPNEKEVFDILQDDLSKCIFLIRKKFTETGIGSFDKVCDMQGMEKLHPLDNLYTALRTNAYAIYGAGWGCTALIELIKPLGLLENCKCIYDSNVAKHGEKIEDIEVLAFNNDEHKLRGISKILISACQERTNESIKNALLSKGVTDSHIIEQMDYIVFDHPAMYFDEIILNTLGDYETFVDGGCLDFGTSELFLEYCPNAMKIIAFEPNKEKIQNIENQITKTGFKNAMVVEGALWSHNTKISFVEADDPGGDYVSESDGTTNVSAYALDNVVSKEDKITFVKLDVEGAELEALVGMKKIIDQFKPKLAVSLYHKPFDFVDLAKYINEHTPEYKLYFRHYTVMSYDTVMYCVI